MITNLGGLVRIPLTYISVDGNYSQQASYYNLYYAMLTSLSSKHNQNLYFYFRQGGNVFAGFCLFVCL